MILVGDCIEAMRKMPAGAARCCVTSPPYFGLRDYGVAGQHGLEPTPDEYIAQMVAVFREVRRVLADDGVLWLNIGDSYSSGGRGTYDDKSENKGTSGIARPARTRGSQKPAGFHESARQAGNVGRAWGAPPAGFKQKDLLGIPWMLAFALRADGWYLRQDIIWSKPNPMPESVRDRCTKAHEYVFLLSKAPRYYFDAEAIAEPLADSSVQRLSQPNLENQAGSDWVPGKTNGAMKAVGSLRNSFARAGKLTAGEHGQKPQHRPDREHVDTTESGTRNRRSVWPIATQPFKEAHFATMPEALARLCILAGSAPGDVVLDPYAGAGTTWVAAQALGRRFMGAELNPDYAAMAERRVSNHQPGLALGAAQ